MSIDQESEDLLIKAEDVCQQLKTNLRERVSPEDPSEVKTLPIYVDCFKEALLYRSTELAEVAIDLYRRNALVSAATITRSLLETTALFERLREKCAEFISKHKKRGCNKDDFQKLDDSLRKISLASTNQSAEAKKRTPKQPHEARKLARSLGTRYKFGAEEAYSSLCQFAHPNLAGCIGPFAYWHDEHVEFISDYSRSPSPENLTQLTILLALLLEIMKTIRDEMEDLLPEFDTVCREYYSG